ncbi:MAG: NADP-dependent oxidoreductase [Capsulimonadaceae bacterium]|nr:NADP-dependent oxidoreductase [Capsulimonadaceae bacterium]
MKAIQFSEYGAPDVLRLVEADDPHPGSGQVRVRVAAAGVNPFDAKVRSGEMKGYIALKLPAGIGTDVAGVVDEIGPGVDGVSVGDAVLGWADTGSYAELALVSKFAIKPSDLSWTLAAAIPVIGETAERALNAVGAAKGETLLIFGASGGVGAVAVQLAVERGVTVIGAASAANRDYVTSLGAIAVVYGDGLVESVRALAPQGVDAAIDAAGKGALPALIELRGGKERIVTIADPQAFELGIAFSAGTPATRSASALERLAHLVVDGTVRVQIARTFALEDAAKAHELSESGHAGGKIVLIVN